MTLAEQALASSQFVWAVVASAPVAILLTWRLHKADAEAMAKDAQLRQAKVDEARGRSRANLEVHLEAHLLQAQRERAKYVTYSNGKTYREVDGVVRQVPQREVEGILAQLDKEIERAIRVLNGERVERSMPKAAEVTAQLVEEQGPRPPEGIEPEAWKAALEEVEWVAENPVQAMTEIMDERPIYGPPKPLARPIMDSGLVMYVEEFPGPRDSVHRKRRELPPLDDKVRALVEKQKAKR